MEEIAEEKPEATVRDSLPTGTEAECGTVIDIGGQGGGLTGG